jgi:hypothetical protein
MRGARQSSYAAAGIGNITKSQKKHTGIVVRQTGVEVSGRLLRVLESLQEILTIRLGASQSLWHPKPSSNTLAL